MTKTEILTERQRSGLRLLARLATLHPDGHFPVRHSGLKLVAEELSRKNLTERVKPDSMRWGVRWRLTDLGQQIAGTP